jgi:serine/threonine-protein kinase
MPAQSIQEYRICALIGEGALGTVFRAEHPRSRRRAALKVVHDAFAVDHSGAARFIDEALAVGALTHPHIAELFEVGRLPQGQPYVIEQLLAGETLGDRLRRLTCLPVADVLDFAAQAAGALAAVHEKDMIHGGLTREDFFLVPDLTMPRGERVKLRDFGMARLRRRKVQRGAAALLGPLLYLAPERWTETGSTDPRSDVYALAGLMYHALCGVPPFQGKTADDLEAAHLHRQPPGLRLFNRDVPRHLESAILRALAKRPDDRFASMKAFAQALIPARRLQPISAFLLETRARLRTGTLGCGVALCGFLLISAPAPGEPSMPAPSAVVQKGKAARGPLIIPLPDRVGREERRSGTGGASPRRAGRTGRDQRMAALDRSFLYDEGVWGQRR